MCSFFDMRPKIPTFNHNSNLERTRRLRRRRRVRAHGRLIELVHRKAWVARRVAVDDEAREALVRLRVHRVLHHAEAVEPAHCHP